MNIVRNDLHFTIKDANGTKKIIYAGYDLPVVSMRGTYERRDKVPVVSMRGTYERRDKVSVVSRSDSLTREGVIH